MSLRGRRVENNILLEGNFVEASVINIKMFETSPSVVVVVVVAAAAAAQASQTHDSRNRSNIYDLSTRIE